MSDREGRVFPIQRETLVDKLVQSLQDAILSGQRPPKSRISEVGIAAEFGVSRVASRETLQRLENMNLVRKTRSGREVAQFSTEEFRHIYELKNVVEAFGAMRGSLNASPTEIMNIERIISQMQNAVARNDVDQLVRFNHEFHDSLVFCCKNPKVIECFSSLARQIRWAMTIGLRVPERPAMSLQEHQEIFAAFRNREAEKVRFLLETHSQNNLNRILGQLEQKGTVSKDVKPVMNG